jgi:hypothetical protein
LTSFDWLGLGQTYVKPVSKEIAVASGLTAAARSSGLRPGLFHRFITMNYCIFIKHGMNMPHPPKGEKPTVGFLARFLWKALNPCKLFMLNGLQIKEVPKNRKNAK